jgi:Mycothiol maleylpyruvate isomerase N-terminal domain
VVCDGLQVDLMEVARSLNEGEWHTPSAAVGWSVQDVVSHVGCLPELLQPAVRGEAVPDSGIEPLNEVMVAGRRDWDTARRPQSGVVLIDGRCPHTRGLDRQLLPPGFADRVHASWPRHDVGYALAELIADQVEANPVKGPPLTFPGHVHQLMYPTTPAVTWIDVIRTAGWNDQPSAGRSAEALRPGVAP